MSAHQIHLLEVWSSEKPHRLAVAWPAGAGAIGTLCEVVKGLATHERVLIVTERIEIAQQFLQRLNNADVPSCFVDRAQFLRLQSSADTDSSNWPLFQVFALTSALAAKPDVAASLQRQRWDLLLLLDTTHTTTQQWVDDLQKANTRVLWKLRPGYDLSTLQSAEWTIDHMTIREAVLDRGLPGGDHPRMEVRIEMFEPSAAEMVVEAFIDQIIQVTKGTSAGRMASTLRTRWLSSPASLESGLRRVENALNWQWPLWDEVSEDVEGDAAEQAGSFGAGDKVHGLKLVNECLAALDELGTDNKLQRLVIQLKSRGEPQSTCVFVRYRDTATYIHSALEDEGLSCVLVHGGMPPSEVNYGVYRFLQESGQVLVMTTAMLTANFDLRPVRNLVLYDAPATTDVMSQTLARFHLHVQPPLCVTVIGDRYSAMKAAEVVEQASQFVV